jgi:hypothetical protein
MRNHATRAVRSRSTTLRSALALASVEWVGAYPRREYFEMPFGLAAGRAAPGAFCDFRLRQAGIGSRR